jgi:hypothetical protein
MLYAMGLSLLTVARLCFTVICISWELLPQLLPTCLHLTFGDRVYPSRPMSSWVLILSSLFTQDLGSRVVSCSLYLHPLLAFSFSIKSYLFLLPKHSTLIKTMPLGSASSAHTVLPLSTKRLRAHFSLTDRASSPLRSMEGLLFSTSIRRIKFVFGDDFWLRCLERS